jgi:hypothetical protein
MWFLAQFGTPAAATQSSALPTTSNRATIPIHLTLDLASRTRYENNHAVVSHETMRHDTKSEDQVG